MGQKILMNKVKVSLDLVVSKHFKNIFLFTLTIYSFYLNFLSGDAINHNMFKKFETFDDWCKSFWCAFGIFFPAVSGFLAGTNKSGELKVRF